MLCEELGVSQAFLACWYIGGGYMDVSEVVVFMIVAKYTIQPLQKHPCSRHRCTNVPGTLGTPLALHPARTNPS